MVNIAKMMKQAQQMQGRIKETQAELERMEKTFRIGRAIEVTARGDHSVAKVKIAPEAVDPEDVEALEDLVMTAVNGALRQVKEISQQRMSELTGGMDLGI